MNVALTAARGRWGEAGYNLVAAVSGMGDAFKAARMAAAAGAGAGLIGMVAKRNADDLAEVAAKHGVFGRTFTNGRHVQMYGGWELQDLVEELAHVRQAIRDGVWEDLIPAEFAKIWELQIDNLFHNIGMIPK